MSEAPMLCGVCKVNPSIGVACSRFAPVSMGFCVTCISKPAEAEGVFEYLWENAQFDVRNINSRVFRFFTYKDGAYISFRWWVKKFGSTKEKEKCNE